MVTRQNAPLAVKRAGRRAAVAWGTVSSRYRVGPDFVVVGAQRCGTTSLFRALQSHPLVLPPTFHKGVNYFDVNYDRGRAWYLSHFPLRARVSEIADRTGQRPLAFESSGYYMHHPWAPRRLADDLPDVKIVVMVRDPVVRAFSAYKHEFARGFESEPLEQALALEEDRIQPELAKMLADPLYQSQVYRHQAYRRRGHYAEQIRSFTDRLGPERVCVIDAHDLFNNPYQEYSRLLAFLELPIIMPTRFDTHNARPSAAMPSHVESELRDYFDPHDQDLADLLGRAPSWRR